jgi:hypothetical protein
VFLHGLIERPRYDLYGDRMNHGIDIHREHSRTGLRQSRGKTQQNQETG